MEFMEFEFNGKKYVAREPSGYQLLKFTEKYMDDNGEVKSNVSKADMIIELVNMIFGMSIEELKKMKWSELQFLNEKANEYLQQILSGELGKKQE